MRQQLIVLRCVNCRVLDMFDSMAAQAIETIENTRSWPWILIWIKNRALRTEIYLVLSALFRSAPSEEVIDFLRRARHWSVWGAMQKGLDCDSTSGNRIKPRSTRRYQNLFIGIGRGEIVPFGSLAQNRIDDGKTISWDPSQSRGSGIDVMSRLKSLRSI